MPWFPHDRPGRTRPAVVALIVAAVVVTPLALGVLNPVEAQSVGCSAPCRVGADGVTRDVSVGVRNRGRVPIEITSVTLDGLPGGARVTDLRHHDPYDGRAGSVVGLPLRVRADDEVRLVPALAGATCPAERRPADRGDRPVPRRGRRPDGPDGPGGRARRPADVPLTGRPREGAPLTMTA